MVCWILSRVEGWGAKKQYVLSPWYKSLATGLLSKFIQALDTPSSTHPSPLQQGHLEFKDALVGIRWDPEENRDSFPYTRVLVKSIDLGGWIFATLQGLALGSRDLAPKQLISLLLTPETRPGLGNDPLLSSPREK